ncbi:hypothetical protein D3C72_1954550 [compost metagenome]
MEKSSIILNASTTIALDDVIFGFLVIMSLAVKSAKVSLSLSIRRMSPSVIIPTTLLSSTTAVTPNRFSEISKITFLIGVFGATIGFKECSSMSLTRSNNFLPKAPPGWYTAKSSALKSRISIRQTARASPITN